MKIDATGTFDQEHGVFIISLDFVPATELEHEMAAVFLDAPVAVRLVPTHDGEKLSAKFGIIDRAAFELAAHNLENRKRAQDGRPSLEQEAVAAATQTANQQQSEADAKAAREKAERERLEARDRIEKLAAQEIADRALAPPPAEQAPEPEKPKAEEKPTAKEPDKVQ